MREAIHKIRLFLMIRMQLQHRLFCSLPVDFGNLNILGWICLGGNVHKHERKRGEFLYFAHQFQGVWLNCANQTFSIYQSILTSNPLSRMAAPSVMIFPNANGESVKRSLILRNVSNKDVIVKLVVTCPQSVVLESNYVLVQTRKYAVIPVSYQQKAGPLSPQELSIYMRPIEAHNHEELKKWIKGSMKETTRQLVCKLRLKVDSGYSAFETIIDLPGKASMYETATKAIAGVDDKDTVTCHPIDYDTNTAANIAPADFANAMALEKQEKCWILGPVIDYLFPPTNGETCNNDKEKENNMNPCAGFV